MLGQRDIIIRQTDRQKETQTDRQTESGFVVQKINIFYKEIT